MVNPASSFWASSRPGWVASRIYAHNHQFSASNRADLKTKISLMANTASAFPFFRATAHLFYLDMAKHPSPYTNDATAHTWLAGDAHIGNFGARRNIAGLTVFGLADFDEGCPGQYLWDLRRLAVSMMLAGRLNRLQDSAITVAIQAMSTAYLGSMTVFRDPVQLLAFDLTEDNTSGVVQDNLRKAAHASPTRLLDKYTVADDGARRQFRPAHQDLSPVSSGTRGALLASLDNYAASVPQAIRQPPGFYQLLDARQRLGAGVGSLGKLRWYLLLQGVEAPVLLEVKQAIRSAVLAWDEPAPGSAPPTIPLPAPAVLPDWLDNHEGARVARSQRALQRYPDPLCGWTTVHGTPCAAREKSAYQRDFDPAALTTPGKLATAAGFVGMALAHSHALGDLARAELPPGAGATDAPGHDVARHDIARHITALAQGDDGFHQELLAFAQGYTVQVELDWQALRDAKGAGTSLY